MARAPRNYESLRDSHQQAIDAIDSHLEPDQPARIQQAEHEAAREVTATSAPERPEGHYGDRPGWTDSASMPAQQKSALAMANDRNAQREALHAAHDKFDQHVQPTALASPAEPAWKQELGEGIANREPPPSPAPETESPSKSK
jgi:hypothetical protein